MPSSSTPAFTSTESQNRWILHMKQNYLTNHDVQPCVFLVPDKLRGTKPEAYTPQLVGLGPHHHFSAHVQHMESHKRKVVLARARKLYNQNDFSRLVSEISTCDDFEPNASKKDDFEPKIRSSYSTYLDLDKEVLQWVVAVDGLFLLYLINSEEEEDEELVDLKKDRVYSNPGALAADVLMLENQIPTILILKARVVLQEIENENSDEELIGIYSSFCRKYSPLKLTTDGTSENDAFNEKKHLLHFMYQMIVKNHDSAWISDGANQEQKRESRVGAIAKVVASHAGELLEHAIEEFDSALSDAKMAGIKLPGNVEKVTDILRNVQKNILHVNRNKDGSLGDQIDIPSAWRLYVFLKMTFEPLPEDCGIGNIKLVREKLYLPVITLRANSEVILRNLVAFEATSKMGSTQMRDYVDLMCGLIKSKEDVDLLKKSGIIETEIDDDEEIVRMCNGIQKSDEKPDKESKVPGTVKEVNDQFNNVEIVKASRSCMKASADCVKFWRPLFPILVVLLLFLQSFCEIWDCRRSRSSSFGGGYLGTLDPEATLMLPRKMHPSY